MTDLNREPVSLTEAVLELEDNIILVQLNNLPKNVHDFKQGLDELLDKFGGDGWMIGSNIPGFVEDEDGDEGPVE